MTDEVCSNPVCCKLFFPRISSILQYIALSQTPRNAQHYMGNLDKLDRILAKISCLNNSKVKLQILIK